MCVCDNAEDDTCYHTDKFDVLEIFTGTKSTIWAKGIKGNPRHV